MDNFDNQLYTSNIITNEHAIKYDETIVNETTECNNKKQHIPNNVKNIVWCHYIGEHITKHRCFCCKHVVISNTVFDIGYVLSIKNGGTHDINNLKPICFACKYSIGTENMIDYIMQNF